MACKLCNTRRPRRFCPGVNAEICSVCCGREREETVNCPLDCVYLREARTREKPSHVDPKQIPNNDVEVTDSFLREQEPLLSFLLQAVASAGLTTEGAVDYDMREALDTLVRNYRTRASGLYYESKPANLVAAAVQDRVEKAIDDFRKAVTERYGLTTIRDSDILGMLVFLQRVEYQANNGRKRGRAFLDFLISQIPVPEEDGQTPPGSSLVLP